MSGRCPGCCSFPRHPSINSHSCTAEFRLQRPVDDGLPRSENGNWPSKTNIYGQITSEIILLGETTRAGLHSKNARIYANHRCRRHTTRTRSHSVLVINNIVKRTYTYVFTNCERNFDSRIKHIVYRRSVIMLLRVYEHSRLFTRIPELVDTVLHPA